MCCHAESGMAHRLQATFQKGGTNSPDHRCIWNGRPPSLCTNITTTVCYLGALLLQLFLLRRAHTHTSKTTNRPSWQRSAYHHMAFPNIWPLTSRGKLGRGFGKAPEVCVCLHLCIQCRWGTSGCSVWMSLKSLKLRLFSLLTSPFMSLFENDYHSYYLSFYDVYNLPSLWCFSPGFLTWVQLLILGHPASPLFLFLLLRHHVFLFTSPSLFLLVSFPPASQFQTVLSKPWPSQQWFRASSGPVCH